MWCGVVCVVWCGVVWRGVVSVVWCGVVWRGVVSVVWCGVVWRGVVSVVWCSVVWCEMVFFVGSTFWQPLKIPFTSKQQSETKNTSPENLQNNSTSSLPNPNP